MNRDAVMEAILDDLGMPDCLRERAKRYLDERTDAELKAQAKKAAALKKRAGELTA